MPTQEQREKQEAKRQRRFARQAERQGQEERERRRRRLRMVGFAAIGVLALSALAFGYWFVYLQPRPGQSVATSGSGDHSGRPSGGYSTAPPTSGPHSPSAPSWGEPGPLSEPSQVHALEHGGVLVQYNCPSSCPSLIRSLRIITRGYDRAVILAPYSRMDALIALTSWGQIDLLDEFDRERIKEFVSKNRGHGPEPISATR